MAKLCSAHYTSNGTWIAPAGVTQVYVIGQGGAGGGSGGGNTTFASSYGGWGTTPVMLLATVVPNTSYTITIGVGGAGGAPRTLSAQNGGLGSDTTFGALLTFVTTVLPTQTTITSSYNGLGRVPACNGDTFVTSGYMTIQGNTQTFTSSYVSGFTGAPGWVGSTPGTGGDGSATIGANGGNATGIGAGGGAGGGGGTSGGSGGNGGPGQLWVVWVE